jgi:Ser-tRNA(Ala) deacylase AlaX
MLPAIEKAIERVKRCPLSGSQHIIPILENYKLEIDKYRPVCKEFEEWSFARTKMMEKHSSLSLNSLLKEINTEAWMWYNGITDKYKNIDMTPYKFFDSLETMNE